MKLRIFVWKLCFFKKNSAKYFLIPNHSDIIFKASPNCRVFKKMFKNLVSWNLEFNDTLTANCLESPIDFTANTSPTDRSVRAQAAFTNNPSLLPLHMLVLHLHDENCWIMDLSSKNFACIVSGRKGKQSCVLMWNISSNRKGKFD